MRLPALALAFLAAALPLRPLPAQVGAPVAAGDLVRVRAAGAKGEFRVTEIGPQGLTLLDDSDQSSRTIPLQSLRKTHVHRGRYSHAGGAWHGFKQGAKWGFIVGGTYGTLFPIAADGPIGPAGAIIVGLPVALASGLVTSAVGAIHPAVHWERVTVAMLPVVSPSAPAPGIGFTIRF
jgi:hypothetical protein